MPPTPTVADAAQSRVREKKGRGLLFASLSAGRMFQQRSTKMTARIQRAIRRIATWLTLNRYESSARNGTRKWPKTSTIPIHHQSPYSRILYQKVSSGTLAFQMRKY